MGTAARLLGLAFFLGLSAWQPALAADPVEEVRDGIEADSKPTVLLGGTQNVRFGISAPVSVRKDCTYALITNEGAGYPVRPCSGLPLTRTAFELDAVPPLTTLCSLAETDANGKVRTLQRAAVKFIRSFRVLLSFDDGPATGFDPDDGKIEGSPTLKTLDALDSFRHGPNDSKKGIKAVFFLLTQPDHFLHDTYRKGETADGAALIREEARRGHVLGVHWGGQYYGQTVTHPRRVFLPPYDYAGAGSAAGAQSALECDLRECMNRIQECGGVTPRYLRPPLWLYYDKSNPKAEAAVLDTYRRLGLKMILTDARFPDGGYAVISVFLPNALSTFRKNLHAAFQSGEDTLVFSMHDSNSSTAEKLPRILQAISDTFEREQFGGRTGGAGDYLNFADTTGEVDEILQSKTRFAFFPDYGPEGRRKK